MQLINTDNTIRFVTFLQHSGIAIIFVFMPILAKKVTESIFEIGIIVSMFSLAQILSELYFGRASDKKEKRLAFIRFGFLGCAITFGLHYFADNTMLLLIIRICAGITSGMMIPAMLAYIYESGKNKKKVASVVSFHALGWLVGIIIGGVTNNEKSIFIVSSLLFLIGFIISIKLSEITVIEKTDRSTKEIFLKNKFLFLSLLLRHIGAASVWTILPIMLVEVLHAKFYEISIVYVSNTLTAFIMMNLMAYKINLKNTTKFKIGIGVTVFVFIGLSTINEWWMAIPYMSLVGATWAFIFIGGNFHLMRNNPKSTSTGIFSTTLSIASVIGPIFAGILTFYFNYILVMYFAIIIISIAYVVSLKTK
ncbi:MAG: MFS transporter [Nitrosopumilaceae archaeon]|nr:MFS transporter [Nitrosopumilaceae archaeon]